MNNILIIDDNPTIHEDIRKILCPSDDDPKFAELKNSLFGDSGNEHAPARFKIDSAYQGQEGFAKLQSALAAATPYAVAIVDMRMPPGWDGIETIRHLWEECPELQVVICTAYSDHSWADITRVLGQSDNLVILKKPFDNIELLQLAHALTKKWELNREVQGRMASLDEIVRARTSELRASEERFHKAFQAMSVPMAILRSQTQACVEVNDSFLALTARRRQEVVGETPARLEQFILPADYEPLVARLKGGLAVHNYNCLIRRNSKETREAVISLEPVKLGAEECLLLALHDITEQRQLESQLRQSQKMEAVGQMAAGIAHDFNNLLTVVQGHVSIQLGRPDLDPKAAKSFEQVGLAAERAAALTRHLVAFSRKQVIQRRPLDLNGVLTRMHPILSRMVGESFSLESQCTPDLPPVLADENSLEQVVMNLVVNARDAMNKGGKLRIFAEAMNFDDTAARRNPEARLGKFICLSVADNGSGIDTDTLPRIFEPFFTTKPQGKGTGLGLSTVYGIVKQHEGWIEVESKLNAGSTFHVLLPVSGLPVEAPAEAPNRAEAPRNVEKPHGTILLVEDEAPVREFVAMALSKHGYKVIEAEDGHTALKAWQETAGPIDLLLTDMMMPNGLGGAVLAERLLEKSPRLRVLYTSGYSRELIEHADRLVEGVNFLPKPFVVSKLLDTVRRCLDAKPEAPLVPVGAAA